MSDILCPNDEAEAADAIRDAASRRMTLRIEGGGTRAGLGRPVDAARVLSSSRLSGVTLQEPSELVISARAGTPLSDLEDALATTGQMLPFEPVDLCGLYGTSGRSTVGGVVAGNWSGPRRISAGATRDHVIGVRFVNGRGEMVKSGGRVMKNVTGLDLSKLMCGAHGTLGFLTEITFKVLPRPETEATLVLRGLDDHRAIPALAKALGSPFEVTGAAHLPAGIDGAEARTLIRIENFAASVDYRFARLAALLQSDGPSERLDAATSSALWRRVRDVTLLSEPREAAIWKLSVAPTRGPSAAHLIGNHVAGRCYYDWGGGLIWLATSAAGDAGAAAIRQALTVTGGHATLVRAPDYVRARVDVFQPLSAPLMTITTGLKASFDPAALLNPGRMYAGC
ncbi:glycolate oxidase subunit GlcE [Lichenihabitans psoromatis]|uniref:glycolate oxidase subunit GlcE n=1 Tax=Lichenihabitans psoromatis TaxID=2528642 RepID=UPI003CCB4E2F